MCQATVYIKTDGDDKELMRDVAFVERVKEGLRLQTLFGEPKTLRARIQHIDLLKSVITLEPEEEA